MLGSSLLSLVEPTALLMREVSATELMPRFRRVAAEKKHDGTVVTEADRAVEAALTRALPQIVNCAVLGEEMNPTEQRSIWQDADWFWCVDPVDGTAVGYAQHPPNCAAARRIEPGCMLPDLDEYVLGNLLRLRAVAEHPDDQAEDARAHPVVQLAECGGVSGARALQEPGFNLCDNSVGRHFFRSSRPCARGEHACAVGSCS